MKAAFLKVGDPPPQKTLNFTYRAVYPLTVLVGFIDTLPKEYMFICGRTVATHPIWKPNKALDEKTASGTGFAGTGLYEPKNDHA